MMARTEENKNRKFVSKSSIPYVFKFIELCLTIIIVGLIVDPTNNGILSFDQNHSGIVYVAWPGYILINTILLISYVGGEKLPKKTQILFSFVGGCLFVAAAAVSLEDWRRQHGGSLVLKSNVQQYSDQTIASGILALFCALTFFIDVIAIMFSIVGAFLYVTASAVVINDWIKNRDTVLAFHHSKQYQDMTISAATLGILTAALMFVESCLYGLDD